MPKKITVYSKDNCPGCLLLKTKLKALGVEFTEVNVSVDEDARHKLIYDGHRQVPKIYIDGVYAGDNVSCVVEKD